MLKRFPFLFFLCFSLLRGHSQEPKSILGNEQEGSSLNVLYRNDASGKIYASTRGLGFLYRRGKHLTGKTRSYYEIDLQSLRHPKEVKVTGAAENRKRFVYGKLNSVLLVRGAIGVQNVIYSKADLKSVEVRLAYSAGPTFAFAKPYYVQVYRFQRPGWGRQDPDEVKFDSEAFTQDSVVGRGAFIKGLPETVIYPGVTGKLNLSFEYAPYTDFIRAIETGIAVDFFPRALPIMARNPAESLIVTLHVGFVFGRKWY